MVSLGYSTRSDILSMHGVPDFASAGQTLKKRTSLEMPQIEDSRGLSVYNGVSDRAHAAASECISAPALIIHVTKYECVEARDKQILVLIRIMLLKTKAHCSYDSRALDLPESKSTQSHLPRPSTQIVGSQQHGQLKI